MSTGHGAAPDAGEAAAPRRRSVTSVVVWFLVVEALLLLTCAPGLLLLALVWPLALVTPDADSIPLVALALLPAGPAISAAVFAWRRFHDDPDQGAAASFWRGYRLNAVDALTVWVPTLVVATLLGVNLTHLGTADLAAVVAVLVTAVAVVVTAWAAHALVVASVFSFRLRDTARIAAYFVFAKPLVSLGAVALAAAALAVGVLAGGWAVALLAAPITFLLARNARPLVAEVMRRFVAGAPDAVVAKPWPGLDEDADESDDADEPDEQRADDPPL